MSNPIRWVEQPALEHRQDAFERLAGRVARLIDEGRCHDRVGSGGNVERVAGRRVDLDPLETRTELRPQSGEAFGRAEPVPGEPEPKDRDPFLTPRFRGGEVF